MPELLIVYLKQINTGQKRTDNKMLKILLLSLAVFCFIHIVRDYLQIKGVKNWFTQIGHVWNAPKYEKHGIVILTLIGLLSLYFGLRV